MTEKFNPEGTLAPEEMAKHLRQPTGEKGKQVGLQMNKGNQYICQNSYQLLNPKDGDHILEVGMGNGFFVKDLFMICENLTYTGVDYSATMVAEATHINNELVKTGRAHFINASIESLPFNDNIFDGTTTTNTIYFWPQPIANAQELIRVLKPNGKLLIAYRSVDCMEQLEVTKHGFEKYDFEEVEQLLSKAGFRNISTQIVKEPPVDFNGEVVQLDGIYTSGEK